MTEIVRVSSHAKLGIEEWASDRKIQKTPKRYNALAEEDSISRREGESRIETDKNPFRPKRILFKQGERRLFKGIQYALYNAVAAVL